MTTRKAFYAEAKTIPCRICGKPTKMLGTMLCDRCWELETRIEMDLDIAKKIIAEIEDKKSRTK
jgi:hypothetical protein